VVVSVFVVISHITLKLPRSVDSGSGGLYSNLFLWLGVALLGVLGSCALTVVTLSNVDLGFGVLSSRTVGGTVLSVVRLVLDVDLGVDVALVRLLVAIR